MGFIRKTYSNIHFQNNNNNRKRRNLMYTISSGLQWLQITPINPFFRPNYHIHITKKLLNLFKEMSFSLLDRNITKLKSANSFAMPYHVFWLQYLNADNIPYYLQPVNFYINSEEINRQNYVVFFMESHYRLYMLHKLMD